MNLQQLKPTLDYACMLALAHHHAGTLAKQSGLALCFDANGDPQIIYIGDTAGAKCPPSFTYGIVIIGAAFAGVVDTVAGLGLPSDQEVQRMHNVILTNIAHLIYETKLADERLATLANVLDDFALNGITAGIASQANPAPDKSPVITGAHPERN